MGVYFKHMKKPVNCKECFAFDAEQYDCFFDTIDCPLVPVPAHGRCVDADAFLATIRPICDEDANAACTFETVKRLMIEHISEAPTIIPAEEGE